MRLSKLLNDEFKYMEMTLLTDDKHGSRLMDMNDHDQSHEAKARRPRIALELADAGIAMRRMQFKRAYPEETNEEIDRRLNLWLRDRPCDAPGRVVDGSKFLGD